ncbi:MULTISPECIES: mechanosensitive ion channel domain-containing protein [unclassified Dyella]|uniref:mechanosensitive ion channel family protein n=1 Tax=unclassified Dyella TaxID=2634549 RepID=UPI000C83E5E1|nr:MULTISPECIES: mechanosensitive ion channel domain-containing protein [unclassified Dyella]MDR3447220.1 mechanosensitive ion channel [Dyella sp.]PMQ06597.1 Small-conductance mechanosensitive channel [Dyella sp. AD56]
MHQLLARLPLSERTITMLINLSLALLMLLIGLWLAARLANIARRAMQRANLDETLVGFLRNLIYGVLVAVLIVMALQQAGVPSAPLVAALGAGGLAIGLALQGTLSNLAWGVLLILFRPLRVGDYVRAGAVEGTVEGISLMYTLLVMPDNREAVVPNAKIGSDAIINFNRRGTRRFELKVGIGYQDDIGKAMGLIRELFAADERILRDPEPGVWLDSLGDSAVVLVMRAHTRCADSWAAQTDFLRAVKERFDAEGISIPFPQRQVTVVQGRVSEQTT